MKQWLVSSGGSRIFLRRGRGVNSQSGCAILFFGRKLHKNERILVSLCTSGFSSRNPLLDKVMSRSQRHIGMHQGHLMFKGH